MLTPTEIALIVAGIAVLGTGATVVQKRYADRRDAWWVRTQWAPERILTARDDDMQRAIGLVVIASLQASGLATSEERKMLDKVADAMLPCRVGPRSR
jgi:hypothetical protein